VGITRAQSDLLMTYCVHRVLYGKEVARLKSRFLLGHEDLYTEEDRSDAFAHVDFTQTTSTDFFKSLRQNL